MLGEYLENVRKNAPLIHNITNYVTVNDVANIELACGASPIMADEAEEAAEITSICAALNINIGTCNTRTVQSMHIAGRKAMELGHPLLLDPVGAGASHFRSSVAVSLHNELPFAVIRGNMSELKALALGSQSIKGVDASKADAVTEDNLEQMVAFIKEYSQKTNSIIAVTGAIDLVADDHRCYVIRNGVPEMAAITGTGCMLSGLMTAYIAANPIHKLEAAATAVIEMGLAGEIGLSHLQSFEGNSTLRSRIIDAVYNMDRETLEQGAKYEIR